MLIAVSGQERKKAREGGKERRRKAREGGKERTQEDTQQTSLVPRAAMYEEGKWRGHMAIYMRVHGYLHEGTWLSTRGHTAIYMRAHGYLHEGTWLST